MSAIDKVLNSHHYLKLDPFVWEQAMSELAALRGCATVCHTPNDVCDGDVYDSIENVVAAYGIEALEWCKPDQDTKECLSNYYRMETDLMKIKAELAASVEVAVLAEREACAKLCEELEMKWWGEYKNPGPNRADPYFDAKSDGACEAAAAIRARGDA